MKTKVKELLINLLPLVLWLGVAALLAVYAINELRMKIVGGVLLSILGVVINYFIGLFFHELGHLTFAMGNEMIATYVNFGIFSVDLKNDKFKFFTCFGKNAGESKFLPNGKIEDKQLKMVAFGGILFNLIYLIFSIVSIGIVRSGAMFCLFGAGGAAVCYIITVNLLPFVKDSDGAIMFKKPYPKALAELNNMFVTLDAGEKFELSEEIEKSSEPLAKYCKYFMASLNSGSEALKHVVNLGTEEVVTDAEYEVLFPEILFYSCINGILTDSLKNRAENYFSAEELTVCDLRAHYALRLATGEKEWANSIKVAYDQMLENSSESRKISEGKLISLVEEIKTKSV